MRVPLLLPILCFCILTSATPAQDVSAKDIGLLGQLEGSLITWFEQLSKSADQLADKEDQRRLRDSLKKLQAGIYEVETNGRNLLTMLQTKPLDKSGATKAVGDTRAAVIELKNELHETGLALRNQYRAGGAEAEQMIADAISQRSLWLSDVQREIDKGDIAADTIKRGKGILAHQATASGAVGEVIEKLPH